VRFWPKTLAGQLIAGILLALVVAQIITFAVFVDERRLAVRSAARTQVLQRTAAVVRLLESSPPAMSASIADQSSDPWIKFIVASESAVGPEGAQPRDWALRRSFRQFLDRDDVDVRLDVHAAEGFPPLPFGWGRKRHHERWHRDHDDDDDDDDDDRRGWGEHRGKHAPLGLTLSVRLSDGRWLNTETLVAPPAPAWAFPTLSMAAATAVVLILMVIILVRRATKPMARLADAAGRLGRGEDVEPVPEAGPEDVKRTTRAFNEMQERLRRFVRGRTDMLAAISHDLRTPITSLRLRAEFIEDEELKAKILKTLEEMQAMTEATLTFAREEAEAEPSRPLDLAALVDSLCSDLKETGLAVDCAAETRVPVMGRTAALRRALSNLIQNAVTYGGRAIVSVRGEAGLARVRIDDEGPGIPAAERQRVFEPFVRLEESRSRETGGMGLGMAIARTLVQAHGGEITLGDAPGGGLRVEVTLPAAPVES